MSKKKYIIAVQGEGRGHMTQAISLYELLIEGGHTVCAVILGSNGSRDIPTFFFENIGCPVIRLHSPSFVTDKGNKNINIPRTLLHNLKHFKKYQHSLRAIDELMRTYRPDVVINLFDLLMGLYFRFYTPTAKMICLAHQYIYFHSDVDYPEGRWLDRLALKFYARQTAHGSSKNLALSFYKIHTHDEGVIIVPPLLRKEIFGLESGDNDFYLVHLANSKHFEDVIAWHKYNPLVQIHCFADRPEQLVSEYNYCKEKVILHSINDPLFLELMSKSRGLASSAGFESVCEAMYLGKPVLMVPIEGHYEQFCNARDAFKAGAGIFDNKFDIEKLAHFSSTFDGANAYFRNWVSSAKPRIYNEILSV